VAGKKIGNKAMAWGALAGTIPDLDIVLGLFMNDVDYVANHRGFSHSFTFALLFSPLIAWGLRRSFPRSAVTFKEWTALFFFGFVTHYLLDSFTTWGTQLFNPFSSYRVAFYSIFVIDPLYTIPLLVMLTVAGFHSRTVPKRRVLNYLGLAISTLYLGITLLNKGLANQAFEQGLAKAGIDYTDYISKPSPLNTILWAVTAKTEEGYYTGFYSLLDDEAPTEFEFTPHQHELLKPYTENRQVRLLQEIMKGYFTAEQTEEGIFINDLRFGKFNAWTTTAPSQFVFRYLVQEQPNGGLQITQKQYRFKPGADYLMAFWQRILGNKPPSAAANEDL